MAAAGLIGTGQAEAASLPGVQKSRSVPGGEIAISVFDQRYSIQTPVTNVPTSREVLVSGKVRVRTSGEIEGATVTPGYLIGCQLNFGASSSASGAITTVEDDQASISVPTFDPVTGAPTGTQSVPVPVDKGSALKAGFTLAPGAAKFVPVIKTSINGSTVSSFTFSGNNGGVAFSQERFGVDGCAGFAQARPIVNVKVASDTFKGSVTLYGKPFSIG